MEEFDFLYGECAAFAIALQLLSESGRILTINEPGQGFIHAVLDRDGKWWDASGVVSLSDVAARYCIVDPYVEELTPDQLIAISGYGQWEETSAIEFITQNAARFDLGASM